MVSITAYPLCWPHAKPRTKLRRFGRFITKERQNSSQPGGGSWLRSKNISVAEACKRVQDECDRIGARDPILSTNLKTRLDGLPRSDQPKPQDPGAALYFTLKGKPHCLPCDTFTDVAQNIAALAAHIEATRAIERYGVADIAAMFSGFAALPSPENASAPSWREVLGLGRGQNILLADAELAYRRKRKEAHPDQPGGSSDAFDLVQRAIEQARQEIAA